MKRIFKYALGLILVCSLSCEEESFPYVPPTSGEQIPSPEEFLENFGEQATASFFGRIVDENNSPIEAVNITIGSSTATTDALGVFSIRNANVFEKFAYIKAEKDGYIKGSRALVPSETATNQIQITLLTKSTTQTISSNESSSVSLSNGTEVSFNGNFVDSSGSNYNGAVNVTLKHLNPDDENMNTMMPGMLFAQNSSGDGVALETYGMIAVELSTSSGESLQLAENSTSRITIPLATNVTNPPATIPLWYFDEENGYWIEDGQAVLQGNQYIGEVSHFTFWNYDYPYPAVNLCITLRDTNGNILPNNALDLYSELLNATGTYGFTNSEGEECGLVPADEELTVTVYSPNCQDSPFTTTIGPFGFDVNTTIIVDLEDNINFTGNFLTCDNINVTNGYVQLSVNGFSQIIPVTDGVIDYTFSTCGAASYTYKGIDLDNNQETEVFTGTINDTTTTIDAGSFSACDTFEDADGDSVPDTLEDVNNDNNLDNDDTDQDGIANYLDPDDDNDGINTIDENYDGDNTPTNDDTDDDGIPNYLDSNDLNLFEAETGSSGCDPVSYNFDALFVNVYNVPNTGYVFYETQADADAETNPIALPYTLDYIDAVQNPIIFVKATSSVTTQTDIAEVYLFLNDFDSDNDGLTDCEETTGVDNPNTDLTPSGTSDPNDANDPNSIVTSPTDGNLQVCDDNSDGLAEFNLSSMDAFYLNGNSPNNYQVTYHQTSDDAANGVNALPTIYTNITNPETLFVRVFELTTGNFDTALLTLEVNESPIIPADISLTECDGDGDGFAVFNLTSVESDIFSLNPNADLSITYSDSNGIIVDTQVYNTASGTVSLEVMNLNTGCLTLAILEIEVDSSC